MERKGQVLAVKVLRKIEDVGFRRDAAPGGALRDVGDPMEWSPSPGKAGDVDAAGRQKVRQDLEVGGRHSCQPPQPASTDDFAGKPADGRLIQIHFHGDSPLEPSAPDCAGKQNTAKKGSLAPPPLSKGQSGSPLAAR